MKTPTVLSVSQLNTYVKSLIDGDLLLRNIYVVGEISNFTNHYRTGHYYLTLKDSDCAVKAVMFRSANMRLKFEPENGMRVIVRGRVSLFERDGQYQLYIDDMQPDGAGALSVAFEQLKRKLAAEGLFDDEYKKPIPARNYRIGVVTSATGAVIQDIRNVISRRFPLAEIILAPVKVQGEGAAAQIAEAIYNFNTADFADVLIVGRGGGSAEDLWAFNEEIVARAVFASDIPVISAVGHETDFTICDFVADLRAPTPSAAAELAVPDIRDDAAFIEAARERCEFLVRERIANEEDRISLIRERVAARSPSALIESKMQTVDLLWGRALASVQNKINSCEAQLRADVSRLDALSPLKVLMRGYSIAKKDGRIVKKIAELNSKDRFSLRLSDGEVECEVL